MKIDNQAGINNPHLNATEGARKSRETDSERAKVERASRYPVGDMPAKTEISAKAKEMAKAKDIAQATEASRDEKISELKRRIANNEYNVRSEDIADKLVDDHIQSSL